MTFRLALLLNLLLPVAGGMLAIDARAQTSLIKQQIPAEAKRLELDISQGVLSVKGQVLKTSPALQIRDPQNRLKLPQSLEGRFLAAVLFDGNGAATRIWLLPAN